MKAMSVFGPSRRAAFFGRSLLMGHCGHGWTCSLPRPVAIDTPQPQDGIIQIVAPTVLYRRRCPPDRFLPASSGKWA
jgi:hypothetical protein